MTPEPLAGTTAGSLAPGAVSSLFQAVGGLRNYRAAAAMLVCLLVALVLMQLVGSGVGVAGSILIGLVATLAVFVGIHASGILLMDQARGLSGRSIVDAIVYGLLCVPKTIVLVVVLVLAAIAVNLLMALLFFISKAPGVGPLLFAVAYPVAVLLSGLTFTALAMGLALSLAAVWEGATISGAILRTVSILQHRLVETVVLLFVVMVLTGVIASFVFGVLATGFWPATGMAVSMLDVPLNSFEGLASIFAGSGGRGYGGYAKAGLFGAGVLWALALTLAMQVGLLGLNLAYLRVGEGLDPSATEGALHARLADARRKAAEMGHKAKEATERAKVQAERALEARRAASANATVASAPVTPVQAAQAARPDVAAAATSRPAVVCTACGAGVAVDDLFCGHCGHRQRG